MSIITSQHAAARHLFAAMLTAGLCSDTSMLKGVPMPKGEGGGLAALGWGKKDGEVFTDSRGRKYRRDAKGTIRRA